jgi:hypothetical protein
MKILVVWDVTPYHLVESFLQKAGAHVPDYRASTPEKSNLQVQVRRRAL